MRRQLIQERLIQAPVLDLVHLDEDQLDRFVSLALVASRVPELIKETPRANNQNDHLGQLAFLSNLSWKIWLS